MALLLVLSMLAGTNHEVCPGPMCVLATHLDGGCRSGVGIAGVHQPSCGIAVLPGGLSRSRVLQRV